MTGPRARFTTPVARSAAIAAAFAVAGAVAAPTDVDPSFGDGGFVTMPHAASSRVVQVARTPGSGMFAVVATTDAPVERWLHRLEDHGGARTTFNGGSPVPLERANCAGTSGRCAFERIATAPADKVVAAGIVDGVDGGRRIAVARWHANGTPDAAFGNGGASIGAPWDDWDESVVAVAVGTDGRTWVVTLAFRAASGEFASVVHRFLADGAPDESIGGNGTRFVNVPVAAAAAVLADDHHLLVAGTYSTSEWTEPVLFRLTPQAELDGSYGHGGYFVGRGEPRLAIHSLELLADGTAMMAGMRGYGSGPERDEYGHAWWVEADGRSHVYHLGANGLPLLPTSNFTRDAIVGTISDRQGGLFTLGVGTFEPFGLEGRTYTQAIVQRRTPEQLPDLRFAPGSRTTLWRGFGMVPAPGPFVDASGRIVFGASIEHAPRRDAAGLAWLPVSTPVIVRLQGGSLPAPMHYPTRKAIEFVHRVTGHYFVTMHEHEAAALDVLEPGVSEWSRTGGGFSAFAYNTNLEDSGANQAHVCRFFSGATFAPLFSHFYTPYGGECSALKKPGSGWTYEGLVTVFGMPDGDTIGSRWCRPGRIPLYRAYNDKASGAPNHRYTIDPAILDAMIAQGWTMEGEAATRVFACVPGQ